MGGTTETHRPTTAIVGGGASGLLAAVHLARMAAHPRRILIFEPGNRLGAGVAFSTDNARHLLNAPARCMSAFEESPDDFVSWLRSRATAWSPDDYVPRRIYRRYLQNVLARTRHASAPGTSISWIRNHVDAMHIENSSGWRHVVLETQGGSRFDVDDAVLAVGAPPSSVLSSFGLAAHPLVVTDPWAPGVLKRLPCDRNVLVVGTGLTMIDVALALNDGHGTRQIHAISRSGLMPAVHDPAGFEEWPGLDFAGATDARTVLVRFREAVRDAQAADRGWRNVVSAARSRFPSVWSGLPDAEKARLLRHVGRTWDVHRHRASPQVAESVDEMTTSGRLSIRSGRITEVVESICNFRATFDVTVASGGRKTVLGVGALVDCSGPGAAGSGGSLLMSRLMAGGLTRPHPSGLGIGVDEQGSPVGANGVAEPLIQTIGWARGGNCFESTAIPELRRQAAQVAIRLVSGTPYRSTRIVPGRSGARPVRLPALVAS